MFSKFKFLLLESIKSIGRIKIHSIVSSLAIAVSLIILSLSYCLYTFLSNYKSQITDIYKVEVYFENNVCKSDLNSSFLDILTIEGILSGDFIDENETEEIINRKHSNANLFNDHIRLKSNYLNIMESSNIDDSCLNCKDILDECKCYEYNCDIGNLNYYNSCTWEQDLGECIIKVNPLPMAAEYNLNDKYRNDNEIKKILNQINEIEYVEEARCDAAVINQINNFIQKIFNFIFIIGLIIGTVTIFYVSNTILLVIYSRKEDIEILKLLGASNNFIKFPYILEGMIIGLFGAILSLLILWLIFYIFIYLSNWDLSDTIKFNFIILANILIGPFLGFLGSSKALSSYVEK